MREILENCCLSGKKKKKAKEKLDSVWEKLANIILKLKQKL